MIISFGERGEWVWKYQNFVGFWWGEERVGVIEENKYALIILIFTWMQEYWYSYFSGEFKEKNSTMRETTIFWKKFLDLQEYFYFQDIIFGMW